MAHFEDCVEYAVNSFGFTGCLKEKQLETLKSLFDKRDTISILPTGYGKSIIFQLLPWFLGKKLGKDPMIVIVVSPLTSLMDDQLMSLRKRGINACSVNILGKCGYSFDGDDLKTDVPMTSLQSGNFNIIYAHPVAFSSKSFGSLLRSDLYQERVCAVVADEVHMISEWGTEFRPEFKKLGDVICIFENASHLALTATATVDSIKQLSKVLNMIDTNIIKLNPDRPNIEIEIRERLPNNKKFDKFDDFIKPLTDELREKQDSFPLTIVYVENLESLGYFYKFLSYELKECSYVGEEKPENRLYGQYHKDYPESMKTILLKELVKPDPKLRLIFATVALGMGLNAPSIRRIIHFRPPTTMEKYAQEIGRAGRDGGKSTAILHFNKSDISKGRKGLSQAMRDYCLTQNCFRQYITQYFGFNSVLFNGDKTNCCSNCKKVLMQ